MHWESGLSGVVEGLGMHWDSLWLTKERPSGAAWGRFGEWVQQPGRLGLIQLINCSKTRPGYKDRPSGAARGRLEGLQG